MVKTDGDYIILGSDMVFLAVDGENNISRLRVTVNEVGIEEFFEFGAHSEFLVIKQGSTGK